MSPPPNYGQAYFEVAYGCLDDPVFRRRWARACALMGGYADLSCRAVLEFGAGLGQNLGELRAGETWAVDISEASATACRALGYHWRDCLEDVPDRLFDVVICHHSLEHVADPFATLVRLREKVAADGMLFLAVPVETGEVPPDLGRPDLHRHLYSWTPNTLKNLCLEAGWRPQWMRRRCGRGLHRTLCLALAAPRLFLGIRNLADRLLPAATGEIVACCRPG